MKRHETGLGESESEEEENDERFGLGQVTSEKSSERKIERAALYITIDQRGKSESNGSGQEVER